MNQRLDKSQRLKSKKRIQQLFDDANVIKAFPLILLWRAFDSDYGREEARLQFGVAVPKRKFKSAVKRNRIKRRIRESYRLRKAVLEIPEEYSEKCIGLMFIYTHQEICTFKDIDKAMAKALYRFENAINP